jgi:hypothetical protein
VNKLRVIVGQGTATEVYCATLGPADGYDTVVIGPLGLWAALPSGHRMGQPAELLSLPGQPTPPHTTASGRTPEGLTGFLDVQTYQEGLLALASQNRQRQGTITSVRVGTGGNKAEIRLDEIRVTAIGPGIRNGELRVSTSDKRLSFNADQVIVATGIGPQNKPDPTIVIGAPDKTLGYPQLMESIDYLNAQPPYAEEVAVFGGSATSAWVAAEALTRSKKLLWFTRPKGSEFRGCTLPGDRNYDVLQKTEKMRMLASLIQITYLPPLWRVDKESKERKEVRRARVALTLGCDEGDRTCLVDQLIYSIGGNPDDDQALQKLIHEDIRKELQPLLDQNRVLGLPSGVLAVATPDRRLMIVGAAAYNYAASGFKKQSAPMATLPTASQVPDGIAMIVASVQALNSFMPFKLDSKGNTESNLNLNLANRDQLAVYLAVFHPELSPFDADEIVTKTIALRSSGNPKRSDDPRSFGISEGEFEEIIKNYLEYPSLPKKLIINPSDDPKLASKSSVKWPASS